jgi:hypothetical protein
MQLLEILAEKYGQAADGNWRTAMYSLSEKVLFHPSETLHIVFPEYEELARFGSGYAYQPNLYITPEEKKWGDSWLEEHGIKENEQLFVVLDSSSSRGKLLNIGIYFELLSYFLDIPGVRVLIFDEKGIGKNAFYREWLDEEKVSRIIFSERLKLRQDLCLIGSGYTRLVFGPCTGLLHCASAIYNNFVRNGMPVSQVPVMITYTGKYERPGNNAQMWWGSSPFVHCLVLRQTMRGKQAILLSSMGEHEKTDTIRVLPCKEYTFSMIVGFLKGLSQWDHLTSAKDIRNSSLASNDPVL